MTCATVKPQLPLAASGDLAHGDLLQVQRHCDECAACAAELKALQATLQALTDAGPMAVAAVDIAPIIQAHAMQQTHSLRRWRRAAVALAAAAAILVGFFGLTRLELRWEAQQLVVRWGQPIAVEQKQPPSVVDSAPKPVPTKDDTEIRLARLEELILAVAENTQAVDVQLSQHQRRERLSADALSQIAKQLVDLRQETRRDRAGLYAALQANVTPTKE